MSKAVKEPDSVYSEETFALKALSSLSTWERNYRKGDVDAIAASISRFGFNGALRVWKDNIVMAGNHALLALRQLKDSGEPAPFHVAEADGDWYVKTIDLSHLNRFEAEAFAVADNHTQEIGSNDDAQLAQMLKEISEHDSALVTAAGYDDEALKALLATVSEPSTREDEARTSELIDKADELRERWQTASGQLWHIPSAHGGKHLLLCGDCTDNKDVALVMNGCGPVLMNTDPPYGIDYAAVKNGIPRSGFRDIQARGGDIENDNLTDGAALQVFLESMIRAAVPYLISNPAFYLWHPMLTQGTFFAAAAAADILIHRQIIWVKPHMVLTRSGMYHWKHELCFYGWIRGKMPAWYGDKSQTSVWEIGEPQQDRLHPTQKPIELFTRPMLNHTKLGEYVYEPFAGSGSQYVAAEQNGRLCCGLEIAPKYVAVTLERFSLLGLEPKLVA